MDWERRFKQDILKKAKTLSVHHMQDQDGVLTGSCDGHQVTIKYTAAHVTSMRCDCQNAKKGRRCVHMAAVLNDATRKEEDFYQVLLRESAENTQDDHYLKDVHEKKAILKHIRSWANRSHISVIRHVYLLDYVVSTEVPALMAKGRTIDACEVILRVLMSLTPNHGLRVQAVKDTCFQMLHQLITSNHDACVRQVAFAIKDGLPLDDVRMMITDFQSDQDIKVIADAFGERLRSLSSSQSEEALALCSRALSMMLEHHHMLLDWMDQYGHQPYGRYMFVKLCHETEREEAVKILQEALREDTAYASFMTYYQEIAPELYKETGMTKDYVDALLDQYVRTGLEEDYVTLKTACESSQWPFVRNQLLHRLTKTQELELYVKEGLYEELKEYVLNNGSLLTLEKYREILAARYPEDVLRRYRTLIWKQAEDAHSESACIELTTLLATMLAMKGGRAYVEEIVKGLEQAYRRNQTMMHVLKVFKKEQKLDKRSKKK